MKKVKFNIPFFNKKHTKNIEQLYKNRNLAGDNFFSKNCEKFLKRKYKFENLFLTDSCSSAFEIIATCLRNLKKKEIIIPSYSYPTVASSFIKNGFKIIFVDNLKDEPFIDKEDLKQKITKNTSCLVMVHHYGSSEDIDYFIKLKKKYNLILIEDAAQSINLKYKSKYVGSYGDFGAISFHETKNIQCGLGGCLIINNTKFLQTSNYIWNRGTNRSKFNENKIKKYSWYELGSSYYPSEFQSLVLFNQLNEGEKIFKKRKETYFNYIKELKNIESKKFKIKFDKKSNYHTVYLICKNYKTRNSLQKWFDKFGIETSSHYEPLDISYYSKKEKLNKNKINCKNAKLFSQTILRLPLHLYLKKYEIKRIGYLLNKFNNAI